MDKLSDEALKYLKEFHKDEEICVGKYGFETWTTVSDIASDALSTRKELERVNGELDKSNNALFSLEEKYPRVFKLIGKGEYFLVVAKHEPYFRKVYDLICWQEMKQGTWTAEDEQIFLREISLPAAEGEK